MNTSPLAIATKTDQDATFAVFKTARGMRWIAFSSNGYEDKDKEIVSTKALEADVQRTAEDGLYGPLRWWHCGNPDPTDLAAPWGAGVDLGWCDYAAMSGPFLVESGTFISDAVGETIARKAGDLAISLGFFHPKSEPDADGVFSHIRRFERSLAPYGRVSNPLTAFYVPGANAVNQAQMQALKALLDGNPAAQGDIESLISKYTSQASKTADAAGLRFKTADGGEIDAATMIANLEAQIASVKAMVADKAPPAAPAVEAVAEMVEEAEEPEDDFAGDMSIADFKALIGEAVKAALGDLGTEMKAMTAKMDMAEKMGKMLDEFKGYFGGQAQKDDSRSQQIATLETKIKTLSDQLSELLGDQPAAVASESGRTVAAVETPDKFEVQTKAGAPAYKHPADAIGAWVEGMTS